MKAMPNKYSWRMEGLDILDGDPCIDFPQDVLVAIGDEQFDQMLSVFPFGKFAGPAAFIGQDVLTQHRMWLSARTRVIAFDVDQSEPQQSPFKPLDEASQKSWADRLFPKGK